MKKLRVIELFAGYGSQSLALKRLKRDFPQFDYESVAFCEIDPNAIKAYRALHGTDIPNLGDITTVDPADVPDCDLMTWSFPCTDISSAGLQQGLSQNSGTRSSLCWEAVRLFQAKRPKYLLMENVRALVSKKFLPDFMNLCQRLEEIGYKNYWQIMNAKDYGVPQNRERVFMVSILGEHKPYVFPKPFKLEKRLKDVLEKDVDERYYLSEERVKGLIMSTEKEKEAGRGFEFSPKTEDDTVANSVTTAAGTRKTDNFIMEPKVEQVANIVHTGNFDNPQRGRIYSANGISPCLNTEGGVI